MIHVKQNNNKQNLVVNNIVDKKLFSSLANAINKLNVLQIIDMCSISFIVAGDQVYQQKVKYGESDNACWVLTDCNTRPET